MITISAASLDELDEILCRLRVLRQRETQPLKSGTPLDSLELSVRTTNVLCNGGIGTLERLITLHEREILRIDGMGRKGLNEIKEALSTLNLTLKYD